MVTNPNNPTGAVLTEEEMDEIVRVARKVGAWIVSDEVYRGAEVASDTTSPTFWGRYPKVIVTAGLSKAFGLPGLRIGWIVAPPKTVASVLGLPGLHDADPDHAVGPARAGRHGAPAPRGDPGPDARDHPASTCRASRQWIRGHGDAPRVHPAGRRGDRARRSTGSRSARSALFDRLRLEKSVLITPGAHFGIGRYIRIGYGYDVEKTLEGLARVDELLGELPVASGPIRRAATAS